MRDRGVRRSLALTVLMCACLLSGVCLGVSGAFASGRQAGDLGDQIRKCKQELRDAQDALRSAKELEALFARKTKVPPALRQVLGDELPAMILVAGGGFGPLGFAIDVQATIKLALLKYAEGKITRKQLSQGLVRLAAQAGRTKRALAETRREAQDRVNNLRARCAALIAKQNQPPKPPPTQAGSFKLVGQVAEGDIKNPNAVELTINAAAKKATNDHPSSLGGGQWNVEYTWKLPETLTPGEKSSVTLGIKVLSNPGQNTFGLSVLAPGIAQQLQAKASDQRTYEFTVPEGNKDAKDITITIRVISAEVIYHYQR